jgi:hypothetical protein
MTHYTPPTVPIPPRSRALLLAWAVAAPALAAEPIGPEGCKACHPAAYEAWRDSAHATAQASLPERSRGDARCNACHAPPQARGAAQAGTLPGVTCESCHGNGQFYARRYVMRDAELARALGLLDVGEKTCARCHDESAPSLSRFDYGRKLPLVEHGAADRQARRAAEEAAPPRRSP